MPVEIWGTLLSVVVIGCILLVIEDETEAPLLWNEAPHLTVDFGDGA